MFCPCALLVSSNMVLETDMGLLVQVDLFTVLGNLSRPLEIIGEFNGGMRLLSKTLARDPTVRICNLSFTNDQ
jgi:hypothetical protein